MVLVATFLAYQQKILIRLFLLRVVNIGLILFKNLKTDINDSRINFNFISFTSNVANLGLPVFKTIHKLKSKNDNNLGPNQIVDTILINGQILSSNMDSKKNIWYNIKLKMTLYYLRFIQKLLFQKIILF